MKKAIKLTVLVMGLLMSLWTCAEAGVLGIGKSILRGGNPVLWFWAGIEGLMKLLEAHPTATKTILGTSLAMQLVGIVKGKGGFPWTLLLLAVTLLACVALIVLLRRR